MWVYGLLLFVVLVLIVLSSIYIIKLVHRNIEKFIKNKIVSWLVSFIPLLILIIGLILNPVNVVVIYIHLVVIVFLTKLGLNIIKKIFKKEIGEFIELVIGVLITCIVLIIAYFNAVNVIQTNYVVYTSKDIGIDNFRIVQISDSHIGTTMNGKKFATYMEDINKLNPDIVVITGDYIDDGTTLNDMIEASKGLGKLETKYGVYFVYGNHDKGYRNNRGYGEEKIKEELTKNNVTILEDEITNITDNIILVGRQDREVKNRMKAQLLTQNIDKKKYIIMLDHQPNDYDNEKNSGVDLVLSGHTHGGQLIPLGAFGVLLGSNDKIYGMETRDKTTFIVNSGISDWAILFKTGTKSEYGVIDIKNK